MTTAEEIASSIKRDIAAHWMNGTIPAGVHSFAELHEYLDANTLGCQDEWLESQPVEAFSRSIETLSEAQAIVDRWLSDWRSDVQANG